LYKRSCSAQENFILTYQQSLPYKLLIVAHEKLPAEIMHDNALLPTHLPCNLSGADFKFQYINKSSTNA